MLLPPELNIISANGKPNCFFYAFVRVESPTPYKHTLLIVGYRQLLFCQVEHGRSTLKQLSLFLERQRNSVKASSNRLQQVRRCLEQKRAVIDRLEVEIERDRVGHDEKLRDYIAHRYKRSRFRFFCRFSTFHRRCSALSCLREQLVWVNAQLTLRRKEMTNRVGEIFVVQRMATVSIDPFFRILVVVVVDDRVRLTLFLFFQLCVYVSETRARVQLDDTRPTSKPRCGCSPLYRIVGLHLPDAEKYIRHNHMEVSTALGHTAHLVSVLSRIFNLPLRYPVRLFGSRSAVWDPYMRSESGPRAHIFPLFSRHQDKLMFEYGVFLLNKNIAQVYDRIGATDFLPDLRRSLGLPTSDLRCTLANVAMLLEHLTEVPLDSDASSSSLRPPMSPASSQGSWSTWTSENSRGIRSVGASSSQWIMQPISVDRSSSLPLLYQRVVAAEAAACNGALFDRELNNDPSSTPPSSVDDSVGQQHSEGKLLSGHRPDVLPIWADD
ncbi:Atg14 domain containing protein [Trichuris trichiura]|uniref:Atg14 domain containing protein n=1 Tax=Trichuris trichiura TaxID=36087 RepID=A0A077Z8C1_TRITR|nr:Atg14 domain containing protein [Trichuris trichiura]